MHIERCPFWLPQYCRKIFLWLEQEWNKLDCNSETLNIFKSKILKFIRPTANSIFGCYNAIGVKLLTRLRLGLSQLHEDKFKHSFQDTLSPLCSYANEVEISFHFLLSCPNYSDERLTFLSKTINNNPNILENTNSQITQFFLYADKNFTASINFNVSSSTVEYTLATKRFDEPLFHPFIKFLITYLFQLFML